MSRLTAEDRRLANLLLDERDRLRRELSQLSAEKIAEKLGSSARTIKKLIAARNAGAA